MKKANQRANTRKQGLGRLIGSACAGGLLFCLACGTNGGGSLEGILDGGSGDAGGGNTGTLTNTACSTNADCQNASVGKNTLCVFEVGASCTGGGGR
ncbi:MAG: hypothetical protein KDD15_34680, partial [Lewinella sp.]|nr:hypothetical protein [Lewinella sp.]